MFIKIGLRLKELRLQEGLKHQEIQDELQLTNNAVHRIEFGKGGTIENFIALVQFFSSRGYNIDWMLSEQNAMLFKKTDQSLYFEFDKLKIKEQAEEVIEHARALLETIEKTTS